MSQSTWPYHLLSSPERANIVSVQLMTFCPDETWISLRSIIISRGRSSPTATAAPHHNFVCGSSKSLGWKGGREPWAPFLLPSHPARPLITNNLSFTLPIFFNIRLVVQLFQLYHVCCNKHWSGHDVKWTYGFHDAEDHHVLGHWSTFKALW